MGFLIFKIIVVIFNLIIANDYFYKAKIEDTVQSSIADAGRGICAVMVVGIICLM